METYDFNSCIPSNMLSDWLFVWLVHFVACILYFHILNHLNVPLICIYDFSPRELQSTQLQATLMRTLLKVATKYKTILMANAFPNTFLQPLMKMSLVKDAGIRRIVQEILQTLIDRHGNTAKLALT